MDGTITSWGVGGLEGTGRLLVIAPASAGRYEIVAESAEETEPCVMSAGACGGDFGAVNPQYAFATNLPISAGDLLGIELISQNGCDTQANPTSQGCGFVGSDAHNPVAGSSTFWDQTPQLGIPTSPSSSGSIAEQILLNAVEQPSSLNQLQQTELVQACDAVQSGTSPSGVLSADGYNVSLDVVEPGTVTATVTFDGSTGSGSSVLTFIGGSPNAGAVLTSVERGRARQPPRRAVPSPARSRSTVLAELDRVSPPPLPPSTIRPPGRVCAYAGPGMPEPDA